MDWDRTSLVMFDVLLNHELLSVISHIGESFLQVSVEPLQVFGEFAKHDVKGLALELHLARFLSLDASNSDHKLSVRLLEDTRVQDVELLLHSLL